MLTVPVLMCDQKIETGIYNPKTRFFFVSEGPEFTVEVFSVSPLVHFFHLRLTQKLTSFPICFQHQRLQTHAQVSSIELLPYPEDAPTPEESGPYGFYAYNFFLDSDHIHLRYVWSLGGTIDTLKSVFTDTRRFHGKHFTIGKIFCKNFFFFNAS